MEKEIITMVKLQERCDELGAVLKYGDKVLTTWLDHASFNAEIYEFVETEEETGKSYVECELTKIAADWNDVPPITELCKRDCYRRKYDLDSHT